MTRIARTACVIVLVIIGTAAGIYFAVHLDGETTMNNGVLLLGALLVALGACVGVAVVLER